MHTYEIVPKNNGKFGLQRKGGEIVGDFDTYQEASDTRYEVELLNRSGHSDPIHY
jgi:hypothetical protein